MTTASTSCTTWTDDIEHVYEQYESSPYEIDREHRELPEDVIADDQLESDIELLYPWRRVVNRLVGTPETSDNRLAEAHYSLRRR